MGVLAKKCVKVKLYHTLADTDSNTLLGQESNILKPLLPRMLPDIQLVVICFYLVILAKNL